jgi:hypothetical protein
MGWGPLPWVQYMYLTSFQRRPLAPELPPFWARRSRSIHILASTNLGTDLPSVFRTDTPGGLRAEAVTDDGQASLSGGEDQ